MIYIIRNKQQEGPFADEEVRQRVSKGELALTDLGWREGLSSWKSLGEILEMPAPPPLPASVAAPSPQSLPDSARSASTKPSAPIGGRSVLAMLVIAGLGLLGAFIDVYVGQGFLNWTDALQSEVQSQHPFVQSIMKLLYERYGENGIEIVRTAGYLLTIFGSLVALTTILFFFGRHTKILGVVLLICGIAPMFHHKFEFFGLPMALAGILTFFGRGKQGSRTD